MGAGARGFLGSARRVGFALGLAVASFGVCESSWAQGVTYRVTFKGTWTTASTPGGLPSGAHFSTLIGAVHNSSVSFWSPGGTASAGIESMAEVGGTGSLQSPVTPGAGRERDFRSVAAGSGERIESLRCLDVPGS